ncbi:MAG: hypothetical protein ACKN9D_18395 [Actinomycetales bacterium]
MTAVRFTSPGLVRRRTTAVVGIALAGLLALSACSSGGDTAAPSSSAPASSSDLPSAEASEAAPGVAELEPACLTYFELDLFNSDYAAGIVADGGMTEKQAKAEYLRLVKKLVADSDGVEGEGAEGAQRINANAKKMRKIIAGLGKKTNLGEIPAKKAAKLAAQASRIQGACANNGYPLPDVNAQARSDAGVTASS